MILIEIVFEKAASDLKRSMMPELQPQGSFIFADQGHRSQQESGRNTEPLSWDRFCAKMTRAFQGFQSRKYAR